MHRGLHHPGLHGAPDVAATVHVEPVVLQRHLGEARAFACWMAGWHLGGRVAPPHLPHVPPQLLPALPHPPGTEEVREEEGSTECHLIKGSMIYIAAWAPGHVLRHVDVAPFHHVALPENLQGRRNGELVSVEIIPINSSTHLLPIPILLKGDHHRPDADIIKGVCLKLVCTKKG